MDDFNLVFSVLGQKLTNYCKKITVFMVDHLTQCQKLFFFIDVFPKIFFPLSVSPKITTLGSGSP